ncbi:hypothetical protein [Histidinibacterium lentulum]|uniref:Uncharacterized protein n=1 Tax=Histidinibacterium lentulum TaxID=2480588 RepID=A0A3N2R5L4_9RHOB|nr:hypothetical protein [Histidinibacterium lentulum]ROU02772.1 hypothetical protein EAT49_10680 [Histidinibacterium lentulum]
MRISPAGHTASEQGSADRFTGPVCMAALSGAEAPGTVQVNPATSGPRRHGARPDTAMSRVAIEEAGAGADTQRQDQVTDADRSAP